VIEVGVTGVASSKGSLFIIDVELGIGGPLRVMRMQGTHFVVKGTMYPEGVRTSTIQDGVIDINSDRGKGKGRVVLADTISEFSSARSRAGKKLMQEMRRFRKGWELNLTLEAAYAKFWFPFG
jgi:hypothetical protein